MRTVHGTVPPPFNGVGISWSHFFAIFFLPLYQSTWSRLTWVTEIQSHQGFYLPTTSGSCAFDGWSALFHTRQTLFCVKLFDSLFDLSSYHIISSFISYLSVIYLFFAFRAPSSNFVRRPVTGVSVHLWGRSSSASASRFGFHSSSRLGVRKLTKQNIKTSKHQNMLHGSFTSKKNTSNNREKKQKLSKSYYAFS